MNKLDNSTRSMILQCLTEGMSARATSRLTKTDRGTVLNLLAEVGEFVQCYHDHVVRNLPTTRVECDEQWSFCGAKQRNAKVAGQGDLWTYAALDADAKLVISWLVGPRTNENAVDFIGDLSSRLAERVQLTTDGHGMYLHAVRVSFDFARCDYARLVKVYGQSQDAVTARRYSPPVCTGAIKERMIGRPDMDLVSTSYVERFNLNTRMNCRRFTRLTNAFSKKAENHANAVALTFFAHNFIRAHGTLTKAAGAKTTPAMAAGLTNRVWGWEDVVRMMDASACRIGAGESLQ